jgi:hypothetical protein
VGPRPAIRKRWHWGSRLHLNSDHRLSLFHHYSVVVPLNYHWGLSPPRHNR